LRAGPGRERPGLKKYRFLFKILLESIDLEGRAGSGEAGTLKIIIFQLKSFKEVSIIDSEEIEN
jgi:hypothetical protein